MSFLFPLYLAGLAAVTLPIALHLIRRHTRQHVTFSSLMFLTASPPRIHRRSRLEHIVLLLLRCAIVCLLALVFARPFFQLLTQSETARPGQRIVVLVDTSASMRRGDLWSKAVSKVRSVIEAAGQNDRVALLSFDQHVRTRIDFDQWASLGPAQRKTLAKERLEQSAPTWAKTDLGSALVQAAETIEQDKQDTNLQMTGSSKIVLVSDLQQGSGLEALQAYQWPGNIELHLEPLRARHTNNAGLQWVSKSESSVARSDIRSVTPNDEPPRVRVWNSADATVEQFQLRWDTKAEASSETVSVFVPPGHYRVVRAPARPAGSNPERLVLDGDDHDFDNSLYLAPHIQKQINILYLGNDAPSDPAGSLYYLQSAFQKTRTLDPQISIRRADDNDALADIDLNEVHLAIVTDPVSKKLIDPLRTYLESGRTILLVMKSGESATTLRGLARSERLSVEEADVDHYAMLGQLDFKHPLLSRFADPRYSDFTKIHFWKYRRIVSGALLSTSSGKSIPRVLASFDNGDPAWIDVPIGKSKGSLVVYWSGWHLSDSQLARSSKFVPLLYSILYSSGRIVPTRSQFDVGDPVPLPSLKEDVVVKPLKVLRPDQTLIELDRQQKTFKQTHMPGLYSFASSRKEQPFAINLASAESRTAVMPVEKLEAFVGPLQLPLATSAELAKHHLLNTESEDRQKYWRWLLLEVFALLIVETWLAGWLIRRPASSTTGLET